MELVAILNCVHKYLKCIALATAMFLLCSNLDNIPDCPELLASTAGISMLVNGTHHASGDLNPVGAVYGIVPPPTFDNQFALEAQPVTLPCWVTRSLHQAADSSPPGA
jgi:hypothetical protein